MDDVRSLTVQKWNDIYTDQRENGTHKNGELHYINCLPHCSNMRPCIGFDTVLITRIPQKLKLLWSGRFIYLTFTIYLFIGLPSSPLDCTKSKWLFISIEFNQHAIEKVGLCWSLLMKWTCITLFDFPFTLMVTCFWNENFLNSLHACSGHISYALTLTFEGISSPFW